MLTMFLPRGVVPVLVFVFAVAFITNAGCAASTPQGPIVLREQLQVDYANQQVSYPFNAGEGAAHVSSVKVTGPKGAVPAQLADVEYWPGGKGFVKSGRLVFIVDELKPLTSATYTLAYGSAAGNAVMSDLKVDAKKDSVEITTSKTSVRLLLGESKQPSALKDTPAPLLASKLGGAVGGGSKLTGDAQVASWSSVLAESGPVVAKVVTTYTLADGNVVTLTARLFAGDTAVRWDMHVKNDAPQLGIQFVLPPVAGATKLQAFKGFGQWMRADRETPVAAGGDKPITHIVPDSSVIHIFQENSWSMKLAGSAADLRIFSRDPAAWVDPIPMTYGGFKEWDLEMIPQSWENWKRKRLPVMYGADGAVSFSATFAKGTRKWTVANGEAVIGDKLDRVKDMVLDWPADAKRPSPRVFASKEEILDAWKRAESDPALKAFLASTGDSNVIARAIATSGDKASIEPAMKPLREFNAKLGDYDVMRSGIRMITIYDTVVDSGLVTPEERAVLRAHAAYLGYQMADPQTWNMERGYHSGNPNMSNSYTLTLGIIACALSDHPMAKTWSDRASAWMDYWLSTEVGPNGEWLPEGSHYTVVSIEPLLSYALAAKRAGFRDFTNDERLKKVMLYHAKTLTPKDPQRKNVRNTGAWGRGTSGDRLAIEGFGAFLTAKSDPATSKQLQWTWIEGGAVTHVGDGRFGGLEPYVLDRRLPAEKPPWTTDLFPKLGTFLRAHYGTEHESYAVFLSHVSWRKNLDVWSPEAAGIEQWFGRGKPLSTCFNMDTGYAVRHELNRDGVRLARNWGDPNDSKLPFGFFSKLAPDATAFAPMADYVRTNLTYEKLDDKDWFPAIVPPAYPKVTPAKEQKLDWTRQVLFLKDAEPTGPAYLVIRDTTKGGQPTQWQFRTLSEKIGTPEQAKDAGFLADKPGQKIVPARELPAGNRYTAIGQFGVDIEYFIASPASTPRHTLRYGGPDNSRVPEFEDLLLLQQPGDGAYYVVLYPRLEKEVAPTFTTLADGKLIKIAGAFGTDYALLASESVTAAAENVSITGTSASVQQRGAATTLTLGGAGKVKFNAMSIASPVGVSAQFKADAVTVTLSAESTGGDVTIEAPAGLKVKSGNAKLSTADGGYKLTVPAGAATIILGK